MQVIDKFDYRNATAILDAEASGSLNEVLSILQDQANSLDLSSRGRGQRNVSRGQPPNPPSLSLSVHQLL